MTNKPTRRKSNIQGSAVSGLAAAPPAPPTTPLIDALNDGRKRRAPDVTIEHGETHVASPPGPAATTQPNEANRKGGRPRDELPKAKPTKTAFYQDPDQGDRMRAAYLRTAADEGWSSLSAFIVQAVEEKVRSLEAKYNDGKAWPPLPPGNVPAGRPAAHRHSRGAGDGPRDAPQGEGTET